MQLTSRWISLLGAATFCVVMCSALDDVAAQSHRSIEVRSAPAPPIVLDLVNADFQADTNTAAIAVPVDGQNWEVGDEAMSDGRPGFVALSQQTVQSPAADEVTLQTDVMQEEVTRLAKARPGKARPGKARPEKTRPGKARLAKRPVAAQHAKSSTGAKSGRKKQGWVSPVAIVSQLKTLSANPATAQWAGDVQRLIELLLEEPTVSSTGSAAILMQLETKVRELDQIILNFNHQPSVTPSTDPLTSQLSRLRYDLAKRTVIWRTIQKLPAAGSQPNVTRLASSEKLSLDYLSRDWQDYLRVAQLQDEFASLNPDAAARKKVARFTLARMASPSLSDAQRRYVNEMIPAAVVTTLKQSAAGEVNQYKLLKAIEWNEQNPSGVATNYINDQFQNLMWSPDADRQAAAMQLQAHYRNANLRLAVSQDMLNRLIPDSPAVNEPVREQVLGADVSGYSQIRNRLSVKLVDDPSRIALKLQTLGEVDSDTIAKRSGFEVRNEGMAKFQAFKKLTLDRMGRFSSDKPVASAQARQRLIGMRSKLDPFPVVNWIARRVAEKKLAQQTPEATELLEQKIRQSASHQLQQGVEQQVAQMQAYLKANLLDPLISMDLNPEALQLATNRQRVVMRYRLAGIDQMASDSPRPVDSNYDYLSLQLHQSLLNNAIERIEIESETFTPESLLEHLSEVIGFNPKNTNGQTKHEAQFVFANYDAIRVDFVEGKVRIELNLKSLRVGKGKTWRNITISSTYAAKVIGSQIQLIQEGMIGVKGKKFRIGDQIAVRAIFNVVLPDSYQFETIPRQLASRMNGYALVIADLDLADGWVGVTYDEVPMTHSQPSYDLPPIYEANGQGAIYSDGNY
jgi:hypothetical protein